MTAIVVERVKHLSAQVGKIMFLRCGDPRVRVVRKDDALTLTIRSKKGNC